MAADRYFIGPALLSKIRRTIHRVDLLPGGESGPQWDVIRQQLMGPRGRGGGTATYLQRGTYTGSWAISGAKVVTLTGSTNTYSVTNYCIPASAGSGDTAKYNVIFGSVGGTMSAVEIQLPTATCTTVIGGFDLTTLPNYKSGVIQILGHGANNTNSTACFGLQWIDTTACST